MESRSRNGTIDNKLYGVNLTRAIASRPAKQNWKSDWFCRATVARNEMSQGYLEQNSRSRNSAFCCCFLYRCCPDASCYIYGTAVYIMYTQEKTFSTVVTSLCSAADASAPAAAAAAAAVAAAADAAPMSVAPSRDPSRKKETSPSNRRFQGRNLSFQTVIIITRGNSRQSLHLVEGWEFLHKKKCA